MVKANQTCFDLVQLAEEITEDAIVGKTRTANTIYTLGSKKTNQSGPKLN
jgi:hypothetical protein